MEQLLLHLFGDYILQTDWMANEKTKKMWVAYIHAFFYSLPFLFFLEPSFAAIMVIFWSHAMIDRYRLARYVAFAKNWITGWEYVKAQQHFDDGHWHNKFDKSTLNTGGYPNDMPPWMWVWLLIITDNSLHLAINYLALRYL